MLPRVTARRPSAAEAYLEELPDDRRSALSRVRSVIRKHLPSGFEEIMQYGMISYVVPLSRYPDTYNGQALTLASLGSQKNHMAVYLTGIYGDPELRTWFESTYKQSGKKLDAGKSCVRFKKLDDLALDAVAGAIERVSVADLIAMSEAAHGSKKAKSRAAATEPAKARRTKASAKP